MGPVDHGVAHRLLHLRAGIAQAEGVDGRIADVTLRITAEEAVAIGVVVINLQIALVVVELTAGLAKEVRRSRRIGHGLLGGGICRQSEQSLRNRTDR